MKNQSTYDRHDRNELTVLGVTVTFWVGKEAFLVVSGSVPLHEISDDVSKIVSRRLVPSFVSLSFNF